MRAWIVLGAALLAGCVTEGGVATGQGGGGEGQQRARAFTDLASAYFVRDQYKIALDELRKAISADSGYGPAYNVYGQVYMALGEDRLAEDSFRRAIDLDRSDSVTRNNLGRFLCARGRYDEGLEQFSLALRNPLYSQPEQAMVNAGLCAEQKGDLALAEDHLVKALKLQPNNAHALLKLASLHFRQGRVSEARRLLIRHGEVAPATPESLWLGVRVERRLGDRAQEAAYGLQLRKRFPDSNEARLLLMGRYE